MRKHLIPTYPHAQATFQHNRSKADIATPHRPFRVKCFQTIHHCDVDVARGLVLLSGIGTKALP